MRQRALPSCLQTHPMPPAPATVRSQLQVFPLEPNLDDESPLAKPVHWFKRTERKEATGCNFCY